MPAIDRTFEFSYSSQIGAATTINLGPFPTNLGSVLGGMISDKLLNVTFFEGAVDSLNGPWITKRLDTCPADISDGGGMRINFQTTLPYLLIRIENPGGTPTTAFGLHLFIRTPVNQEP